MGKILDLDAEQLQEIPELLVELIKQRAHSLCTSKPWEVGGDFVYVRSDGKVRYGNFLDQTLRELKEDMRAPRMTFNNFIKANI